MEQQKHIKFLDGIRGLAALYVVLYHVVQSGQPVLHSGGVTLRVFGFGHTAVVVFLVLSGYVIMLSSGKMKTVPDLIAYAKKRSIRILPAYYITLVACIVLRHQIGAAATSISIAAHFLLVHNLSKSLYYSISPPMWSVAAEWQIYALFPIMLLIYRRFGSAGAVACAGLASAALLSLPGRLDLHFACPWFIAVFAFGMAACNYRQNKGEPRKWLLTFLALIPCAVLACHVQASYRPEDSVLFDMIVSAATCALLIYLESERRLGNQSNPLLHITESRIVLELGAMSYMLYLVHEPLWQFIIRHAHTHGNSPSILFRITCVGVILAITWPIYTLCDKKPREKLTKYLFVPSKNLQSELH